jgi:hypothetical protein
MREVIFGTRKLSNRKHKDLLYFGRQIKEDKMGGACERRGDKIIAYRGRETWKK